MERGGEVSNDELVEENEGTADEEADVKAKRRQAEYGYLLNMQLVILSMEEMDQLIIDRDGKKDNLDTLRGKSWADLYNEDLDNFIIELEKQEAREEREENESAAHQKASGSKSRGKMGLIPDKKKKSLLKSEVMASPFGERVAPRIDHLKQKAEAMAAAKERKAGGGGRGRGGPKKLVDTLKRHADDATVNSDDELDSSSLTDQILKKSPELKKTLTGNTKTKAADARLYSMDREPGLTLKDFGIAIMASVVAVAINYLLTYYKDK